MADAKHPLRLRVILIVAAALVIVGVGAFLAQRWITAHTAYTLDPIVNVKTHGEETFAWVKDGAYVLGTADDLRGYDADRKLVWNEGAKFNQPMWLTQTNCAAVVDIGGTDAIVLDQNGIRYRVALKEQLQIMTAALNEKGEIILVCQSNKGSQRLLLYDAAGNPLLERITTADADGFPLALAYSDDSETLVTAYVAYETTTLKTVITFFDLTLQDGEVVDKIRSNYTYDVQVPKQILLTDNACYCVLDSEILFFDARGRQQLAKIDVLNEMAHCAAGDDFLAVLFGRELSHNGSTLQDHVVIFAADGRELLTIADADGDFLAAGGTQIVYGTKDQYVCVNKHSEVQWSIMSAQPLRALGFDRARVWLVNAEAMQLCDRVKETDHD